MSQFDAGAWASTDANAEMQSNDPPAPGKYDVVIADARAFTSKAGNDIAIVEWNITGGPQAGYQWPSLYGFKNEGQIKVAKSMCSRIGVDVDTIAGLEDLDRALKGTVGEYFQVEVTQNGEHRNTYVQGRAGAQRASDIPEDGAFTPAATGPVGSTDDVPF